MMGPVQPGRRSPPAYVPLLFLALAAAAEGSAVAGDPGPAPNTKEPRAKEPRMSQPADDKNTYELTVRSDADRLSADLSGYMSVVKVNSATRQAIYLVNRHSGDLAARPIGIFGDILPAPTVAGIRDAIERIKWADLPRPRGGDVNAAVISIDYSQGAKIIQRSFSARNAELLQALSPVMSRIDELGPALMARPLRAITIEVERTLAGLKLVIRNIGSGPVVFADARLPAVGKEGTRGGVSVAEKADAPAGTFAASPPFRSIAMQPLGANPPIVTLKPGQTYEAETLPWSPSQGGTYFARATWEDYEGPKVDPHAVLPPIPQPEQLSDPRPYGLRGAIFSKALKIVIDRPRR